MEGGTWPGSLGKSRGASERGDDELECRGQVTGTRGWWWEGAHGY